MAIRYLLTTPPYLNPLTKLHSRLNFYIIFSAALSIAAAIHETIPLPLMLSQSIVREHKLFLHFPNGTIGKTLRSLVFYRSLDQYS